MKEATIKKHFKKLADNCGWLYWFPGRVKYKENDIFGVFDCVVINQQGDVGFVQLTTKHNIYARRRKIERWIIKNQVAFLNLNLYVFGWDVGRRSFSVLPIKDIQRTKI